MEYFDGQTSSMLRFFSFCDWIKSLLFEQILSCFRYSDKHGEYWLIIFHLGERERPFSLNNTERLQHKKWFSIEINDGTYSGL